MERGYFGVPCGQVALSVPGHPNVFVIGDTASSMQNGKALPGVAQVAIQGGRYVASVIIDRVEGKELNKPSSRIHRAHALLHLRMSMNLRKG
jgi:NADH dehydrogenase FAD-containing subunit